MKLIVSTYPCLNGYGIIISDGENTLNIPTKATCDDEVDTIAREISGALLHTDNRVFVIVTK